MEGGGGGGGRIGGGNGGGGIDGGELVDRDEVDERVDDDELLLLDRVDNRLRLNLLNRAPIAFEFCELVKVEDADEVAKGAGI